MSKGRMMRTLRRVRRTEFMQSTYSSFNLSFLTPEGKRLPGLSDKDTIGYRIEALRLYLEQELGADSFINVYRTLQVKSCISFRKRGMVMMKVHRSS
jgi:hypothetical protein